MSACEIVSNRSSASFFVIVFVEVFYFEPNIQKAKLDLTKFGCQRASHMPYNCSLAHPATAKSSHMHGWPIRSMTDMNGLFVFGSNAAMIGSMKYGPNRFSYKRFETMLENVCGFMWRFSCSSYKFWRNFRRWLLFQQKKKRYKFWLYFCIYSTEKSREVKKCGQKYFVYTVCTSVCRPAKPKNKCGPISNTFGFSIDTVEYRTPKRLSVAIATQFLPAIATIVPPLYRIILWFHWDGNAKKKEKKLKKIYHF